MAEVSAAVIIAQTIGLCVGVVAVIAITGYSIIKIAEYMTEDPYSHKDEEENLASLTDYEDIKPPPPPKTQDTTVRQRNVKKEDIQNEKNESKSITENGTSDEPPKKKEKCDTESQTVSEQGTQTGTCVPQDFTLPIYENRALSDDNASVTSSTTFSETSSTCDSLASTETLIPDVDQDIFGAQIPTWSEMSDADRALRLCPSCEKKVSTITIPCEHPYLCDECAPIMLKFYCRCPLCRKRITGYQSI